ncbi:cytochrome c oxidase accessory protein CcoG [Ketobacter sp. MCCC 1A13808]|uniref:cytochrome c oxidase accessory protein CcoG n=1 Tax=Ketobacter sp. MCCC 1A13808 TaxID=2602738 RepID=UPI000F149237|nr:cytochrome c oxidase accessory protein CcoG [Ketobacter sp. MCCC 1A13808]MVF12672.1 cytochrome c oxidase accessory protein CcoG [Ketobacter sp. MCCC 1A13808]RLP55533.1 MAG: cytochrome c oxidase accessory protein CcoG [Ketobacter sp.]
MTDANKIAIKDAGSNEQIDLYQKREKIYQRHLSGFFQNIRVITIWITLGVYFLGPWLTWDGRQGVLFDLPERKFYIFWFTFWPQDFLYLAWLLIIAAFALFFVTAVAGRIWCGYTCPQTVWTTFFMWIEYITEGDRHQRIRLDAQPWSVSKAIKKLSKHSLWLILAFFTAFTFVGYFAPVRELWSDLYHFNVSGWVWFWLAFFTVCTYSNAGWLREQVCIYMCPYARFQTVMFDRDTLIVTYDEKRGEPRGARKKTAEPEQLELGSCINCKMCVQVCPTGIDIRNGLQIECIGCAACIDACDSIMDQMEYPRGLIRYSTENAIVGDKTRIVRPRIVAYALLLVILCGSFVYMVFSRVPLELDIIRDRNALFRENWEGHIENVYTLKIMNKTQLAQNYDVIVSGLNNMVPHIPGNIHARPGELLTVTVTLEVALEELEKRNTTIYFTVKSNTQPSQEVTEESRFLGPFE